MRERKNSPRSGTRQLIVRSTTCSLNWSGSTSPMRSPMRSSATRQSSSLAMLRVYPRSRRQPCGLRTVAFLMNWKRTAAPCGQGGGGNGTVFDGDESYDREVHGPLGGTPWNPPEGQQPAQAAQEASEESVAVDGPPGAAGTSG